MQCFGASLAFAVFAFAASAPAAVAQPFPTGPVRIISDSAAGSPPDAVLRAIATRLGQTWSQQMVVINMPGASGGIAARAAAAAAPDGYTLMMASSSSFVTMAGAAPNIPIEVPRDLAPVGMVTDQPMFITIAPQSGVKTLSALIQTAAANPGAISYATSGRGRQGHLTGEMLQQRANIKLVMVPYAGGPAQSMSDVLSGRVQILIDGGPSLVGLIKAGKLDVLAVGSKARLAAFPDVPTLDETVPGLIATGWQAIMAPVGTPPALINKINNDLKAALSSPELRDLLSSLGSIARPSSPDEATQFIQSQQREWAPVLNMLAQAP